MSVPAETVTGQMAQAAKDVSADPKLAAPRLKLHAEGAYREWRAVVPMGIKPEQTVKQGYWAHVGHLLRPGDVVQIVPDDLSFKLDVFVRASGRNFAIVAPCSRLYVFDGKATPPASANAYRVDWAGPHEKHRVLRGTDVLKTGFDTAEQASTWAKNHEAATRR